jgi:hypothetical protein
LFYLQAVHGDQLEEAAAMATQQINEGDVPSGFLGSTYVADENLLLDELKQLEMPAPI